MATIISVVNNKGGVGKSTISANLADALGRLGKKVLCVDMDSQASSTALMQPDGSVFAKTMYELLLGGDSEDTGQFVYLSKYSNVSFIPNIEETASLEPDLIHGAPESYFRLRKRLREFARDNFDFVLIDCPPNMGTFVLMSLCASDFGLVPIKAGSMFSLQGLVRAVQRIREVAEYHNPDLRFLRLLINMVDRRTILGRGTVEQVRGIFRTDEVFETIIPVNSSFEGAEAARESILRFDSSPKRSKPPRERLPKKLKPGRHESARRVGCQCVGQRGAHPFIEARYHS